MSDETPIDDSPHRFRLKGTAAEDYLESLASRSFFVDWCFRSPRLPSGKELCDLLVVFDRTAIIWQAKDLRLSKDGRYKQAEVGKNLRQLAGAHRQLIELKVPIELENARRSREMFDPSFVDEVFLISALLGEGEPFFSMVEDAGGHMVHVFTRAFTEIVLTELDTISDFVQYIRVKQAFLEQSRQAVLIEGGEENFLAFYLRRDRSFESIAKHDMVSIGDEMWQSLLLDPRYQERRTSDRISYAWDGIIDCAHEGSERYERVARELARPNRFERRILARSFFDMHVAAHEDQVHPVARRMTVSRDPITGRAMTYCFLFMDEALPRERRQEELHAACVVARDLQREHRMVIGIATEKQMKPTCSYDFVLLDYPAWPDHMQQAAARFREEREIFKSPQRTETSEDEYPDRESKT